jgi:hypothetical protein
MSNPHADLLRHMAGRPVYAVRSNDLYAAAREIETLESDVRALREALLRIKETKAFLGAIADGMMNDALRRTPR